MSVELLHPVGNELVILSNIPLLGVVDFDLIKHHLPNVLKRIDFVLHFLSLSANLIHVIVYRLSNLSLDLFDLILFQIWRAVFP